MEYPVNNEILQSLRGRKSMRVFEERKIPAAAREAVLLAAAAAPTAGNQQLYTILEIDDSALKERLAVSCDNQPFIAKAPWVLVFCADFQKWYDAFCEADCAPRRPGAGDFLLAVEDSVIAAQNAVTAAESLGVGSCYIGDIMERCEEHRELFGLPAYVFPAAMLVFGYPVQQQKDRPKPQRCDLAHIVHRNRYRRMDGAELREMLRKDWMGRTYEDWCAAFCERKYNAGFSREMTRSVKKYMEEFDYRGE